MGLGSIFAKTFRDGRRAALIVGGVAGLFMVGTGGPYGASAEFATIELRQQFTNGLLALPAALRGILGTPIDIEHLGGFLSWRIGNVLPVTFGIWSVLALSGTLAGEAAKGSLDLLVSTPNARRTIALQKVAGHLAALTLAMLVFSTITSLVGIAFARLPGDEISIGAALGQGLLLGMVMLASGAVAFAAAPFVGRTRGAAFGLIALFGGSIINAYSSLSPLVEALRPLSFEAWVSDHRPMAGVTDWPAMAGLGVATAVLLGVGVVGWVRRDIGGATALAWIRLPSLPAGIGGPFRRQAADRTGMALAWGAGVGLYAALIVASASAFAESIGSIPQIVALVASVYPDIDFGQPSGILQLVFFGFASLIFSIAGASFLAGWSGDEADGRLAMVMSVPITRRRWMVLSGLGVFAAIGIMTTTVGASVAVAILSQGGELAGPLLGTAILGLASAAFSGIGLAVGGLIRATLAAPTAGLAAIATFLIDTLGAALDLPEPILQLSLFKHLGQPMAGVYDPVGLVVAAVLAIGGLLVGAWGLQRRDLDR